MRRCKNKTCTTTLPPASKCTTFLAKKGFCSINCMGDHGLEKAQEKRLKDIRKSMNPNPPPKKKQSQAELTQAAFNKMIRLLDEGKACHSCGRYQCGSLMTCGHFRSVGSCPELRYDPRNAYIQGGGCNFANRRPDKNNPKGAETIAQEYEARLRALYGDELVDWVNGPHEMPRWRDDDLRALRKVFSAECRRLERGEGPSRDWRGLGYSVRELIEG